MTAHTPKRNRVRSSISWYVTCVIVSIIFMAFALFYLYLIFWLAMSTVKSHPEIVLDPFALPKQWRWSNYADMFSAFNYSNTSFLGMVWNSVWHSVGCTIVNVWSTASVAYISQKYKSKLVAWVAPFVLFTIIFPLYGSGGAGYRLVFKLGFANSYTIMITAASFCSWNFFYFQAFFSNLSWGYAEAAMIDGANDWQIYYRIMLPQSIGILGAIAITFWSSTWLDYGSQILYLTKMPTLSVGIYYFKDEMVYRARMDVLCCACFVALIPVFALYYGFNNVLFKNISLGGIKM